jgi:hypothetical protein
VRRNGPSCTATSRRGTGGPARIQVEGEVGIAEGADLRRVSVVGSRRVSLSVISSRHPIP